MTRAKFLALLLVCAVAAGAAFADRESAQFASSRGDKALAAKKFDEAEGLYRKALGEDETYLPARYGLAQALLGATKSALAVEELRRFVAESRAAASLPAEWKSSVAKAEKQLADLDQSGTALLKVQSAYVDGLVDLGQRWSAKDPQLAERALKRALEVRPGHAKAVEILAKMGLTPTSRTVDLCEGGSFDLWQMAMAPDWTLEGGELVGVSSSIKFICSKESFEGDYDVHAEAKFLEERPGGEPFFALVSVYKSDDDHYSLGRISGKIWWIDSTVRGTRPRDIAFLSPPQLKKPYDGKQWNRYEIRFRGDEARAYVNGDEIAKEPRPPTRRGGPVGLFVQHAKVAFRKVQVEVK